MACKLCGGTLGTFNAYGSHNLCSALAALGQPTPCLGHPCPDCHGLGHKPRSTNGPAMFLDGGSPGAFRAAIDAWAPKCYTCNGSGKAI